MNDNLKKTTDIFRIKPIEKSENKDCNFDVNIDLPDLLELFHIDTTIKEAWEILHGTWWEDLSWLRNEENAQKFLVVADILYDHGRDFEALERYQDSYRLFPGDNEIRDMRIEEIQKKICKSNEIKSNPSISSNETTKSEKLSYIKDPQAQKKEKCRNRIAQWDEAFEKKHYVKALRYYFKSEELFSYERIQNKIEEINKILADKKNELAEILKLKEARSKEYKEENKYLRIINNTLKKKKKKHIGDLSKQPFSDEIIKCFKKPPKTEFPSNKKECRKFILLWDDYIQKKKYSQALGAYKDGYVLLLENQKYEYEWLEIRIKKMEYLLFDSKSKKKFDNLDKFSLAQKERLNSPDTNPNNPNFDLSYYALGIKSRQNNNKEENLKKSDSENKEWDSEDFEKEESD